MITFFPYTDVHESDIAQISIPFQFDYPDISDLTSPGLALGTGQKVNVNTNIDSFTLFFELTNGQYINLSEVKDALAAHQELHINGANEKEGRQED